jgi:multiple sugar transport system ATP-binding protein
VSQRERQQRVEDVARLLRLGEVLDRPPAELSGGQQQRVALGRALVRRPAVFLLDEPLSNLDARLRLEMRRELHLLHRRLRATMIYVTHDQEEALTLGDRVVVLDRGRVQQADRPTALYERPANRFVAGFFGWPPINLLDGRLVAEGDGLRFVGAGGWLEVPPCRRAGWEPLVRRELTLGVRPEHVRLGAGHPSWEVRLVERFGARRLITVRRGDWTVTASQEGASLEPPGEGERVGVELDLPAAHLFDRAGGEALSHGRP